MRLLQVLQNLIRGRGACGDKAGGTLKLRNTEWAPAIGRKRNYDKEFRGEEDPWSKLDPGRGRAK